MPLLRVGVVPAYPVSLIAAILLLPAQYKKGTRVNLILSFVHPTQQPRTVGPLKMLWIDGGSLRERRDGPIIARHFRHQWEVDGMSYYRLDCTARVAIRFEGGKIPPSRTFGPFNRFSAVDGLAYTDGKVFAFLDGKVDAWLCYDLGQHWPIMVVADAAS